MTVNPLYQRHQRNYRAIISRFALIDVTLEDVSESIKKICCKMKPDLCVFVILFCCIQGKYLPFASNFFPATFSVVYDNGEETEDLMFNY